MLKASELWFQSVCRQLAQLLALSFLFACGGCRLAGAPGKADISFSEIQDEDMRRRGHAVDQGFNLTLTLECLPPYEINEAYPFRERGAQRK
ncbi:hypothetical protein J4Q44_G00303930 [Coregonus suidteri]|uniref:Uncharacterized protein n=1 Tax=Coregonus suidteri TaxID=861788 RepID=A0AAN8KVK5_9TELE